MGVTMPTLHAVLHRNQTGPHLQKAETGWTYDSVERDFRLDIQISSTICAHGPGTAVMPNSI